MLSNSYKAFLIMDQLRRRANISVPQFLHVLKIDISTYSRISENVYAGYEGVSHYDIEKKVLNCLDILSSGYAQKIIAPTSIKQPNSIIDVLKTIEMDLVVEDPKVLIDCNIEMLLSEANKVLNT